MRAGPSRLSGDCDLPPKDREFRAMDRESRSDMDWMVDS